MADATRLFTKTINGKTYTQVAATPRDVVKFTYDGWREVPAAAAKAATRRTSEAAAPGGAAKTTK